MPRQGVEQATSLWERLLNDVTAALPGPEGARGMLLLLTPVVVPLVAAIHEGALRKAGRGGVTPTPRGRGAAAAPRR